MHQQEVQCIPSKAHLHSHRCRLMRTMNEDNESMLWFFQERWEVHQLETGASHPPQIQLVQIQTQTQIQIQQGGKICFWNITEGNASTSTKCISWPAWQITDHWSEGTGMHSKVIIKLGYWWPIHVFTSTTITQEGKEKFCPQQINRHTSWW